MNNNNVKKQKSVAVIGGGAAGLVAARELLSLNHNVVVLEQGPQIGGVWVYEPQTERQILQQNGQIYSRSKIHSSMYKNLRTNLPREIMAFSDFPFHPGAMEGRSIDDRRYPCHQEVLAYLQAFAIYFQLHKVITFNSVVTNIEPRNLNSNHSGSQQNYEWIVEFENLQTGQFSKSFFDAVLICNGHYSTPHWPCFEGQDIFEGKQIHSHDYRTPEEFENKRVVVLGKGPSGTDIAFEVAQVAKEVFISARGWKQMSTAPINTKNNLYQKNVLEKFVGPHSVQLQSGEVIEDVDTVLYCTGYNFDFPFLKKLNDQINSPLVDQKSGRIMPLYKHLFIPQFGDSLSFIGLPFKIVPFPLFEYQCKWIARLLAQECSPLPSKENMEMEISARMDEFESKEKALKQYYDMNVDQFAYIDWLCQQCMDTDCLPKWREQMFHATRPAKYENPETYRDNWNDHELVKIANQQILQQLEFMRQKQEVLS